MSKVAGYRLLVEKILADDKEMIKAYEENNTLF